MVAKDFLNGCVIFPFFTLLTLPIGIWIEPHIGSETLSHLLESLKTANYATIALAGGVGLFFVIEELASDWL